MQDFAPLTENPFWEDDSVSSSRSVNDDFSPVSELLIHQKLCLIYPTNKQRPDGILRWPLKENADL